MNPLVFHVASGQVFFTGAALSLAAAWASTQTRPIFKRVTTLCCILGLIAVALASAAISYWVYGLAAIAMLLWIASVWRKDWRVWSPYVFAGAWIALALLELPYHFLPRLRPTNAHSLTIIGDSVAAGLGESDKSETWPRMLARKHDIRVQDVSHVGDTAAMALKRVQEVGIESPVVLVEIGGNDMFGNNTSAQFFRDLDALLGALAAPNRQVVMLELPLPPLYHEWNRAQRTLAAKHHVSLIPKRVFLSALSGEDATLDTVHLSQSGHRRMAEAVWSVVGRAFE